jgi:hypothetical protein
LHHKYLVFLECLSLGIPVLGILHDADKFLPGNFTKYAQYHFGKSKEKPWEEHHSAKKHHWEHWKGLPIPERYEKEMIADWNATGRIRNNETKNWYSENRERIVLNPQARQFVEAYVYQEGE